MKITFTLIGLFGLLLTIIWIKDFIIWGIIILILGIIVDACDSIKNFKNEER